jgi:hypothetical protein
LIVTGTVAGIGDAIQAAEEITVQALREQGIETEPTFTDRLVGAFHAAMGRALNGDVGVQVGNYRVRVRTLRPMGSNAPEREFGADICVVLDVDIPQYRLSKGFLVQAKMSGRGATEVTIEKTSAYPTVTVAPDSDLRRQCNTMLALTPDSFVFVYSEHGVLVVPASTVTHITANARPQRVYSKALRQFFVDFLMSFVGDPNLAAYDDDTLRRLISSTNSRSGLSVELRPA